MCGWVDYRDPFLLSDWFLLLSLNLLYAVEKRSLTIEAIESGSGVNVHLI